jgi:hypothetical protein
MENVDTAANEEIPVVSTTSKCVSCGKEEVILDELLLCCPLCSEPSWCSSQCMDSDKDSHFAMCPGMQTNMNRTLVISVLTEDQKLDLFREQLEKRKSRESYTNALLEAAAEIDPHILDVFEPKSSSLKDIPFRVWRFAGTTRAGQLDQYTAVSYCWHGSDWKIYPSLTKEQNPFFPITNQMFASLVDNMGPTEGLWIDQSCIDQSNNEEKKLAIASMDLVYRNARRVVVLLEDISIEVHHFEAYMKWGDSISQENESTQNGNYHGWIDSVAPLKGLKLAPPAGVLPSIKSLILRLLTARWFSRAWCVHEHHLADDCQLMVSCAEGETICVLDLRLLIFFVEIISMEDTTFVPFDDLKATTNWLNLRGGFSSTEDRFVDTPTKAIPFSDILYKVITLQSSVPADKISIALNIASLNIALKAGFSDWGITNWGYYFSVLAMAAGDLTCLISKGRPLMFLFDDDRGLKQSWLNWPEMPTLKELIQRPKAVQNKHYITCTPMSISLHLLVLEDILQVAVDTRTQNIVRNFVHSDLGQTLLSVYLPKREDIRDVNLIDSLTSAVQAGSDWIKRFYTELWPTINHLWPLFPMTDELGKYGPLVVKALFPDSEDQSAILVESLLQYIRYQFCRGPDVMRIVQFGPSKDLALTKFDGKLGPNERLAIPECLAETQFMEYARLWVVQIGGTEEENSCKVTQKHHLFGCEWIQADNESIWFVPEVEIEG